MGQRSLLFLIFNLHLIVGCAKISYLWDQGIGQLDLLTSGTKNEELLENPQVDQKIKQKVELATKAKFFFYKYLNKSPRPIYQETVILNRDAVTYLVLATAVDDLLLKQECFPFMGCFPYLGFFSKDKALAHQYILEGEGWDTRIRPVLAYSTLGYFNDPLLSTFLQFEDLELIELIFHELFHTIFFIPNEVDLNESLASMMARKILKIYATENGLNSESYFKRERVALELRKELKKIAQELQEIYVSKRSEIGRNLTKMEAQLVSSSLFQNTISQRLGEICKANGVLITECPYLNRSWNNPALAEFLLYEEKAESLLKKYEGSEPREILEILEKNYKKYKGRNHSFNNFKEYLEGIN